MPSKYDMGKLVEDNPRIRKRRSYIPGMKHKAQLDFNAGLLVPMDKPLEVLPGDTFKLKHSLKIRMTNPPRVPVMDQLVLDLYFFYAPCRILWENFDKFITGDTGTDWTKISDLTIPQLECTDFVQGSLLDYLGCSNYGYTSTEGGATVAHNWSVNALPVRMYYSVWNHYFRFEPLQSELYFSLGDSNVTQSATTSTLIGYYYSGNLTSFYSGVRSEAVSKCVLMPVNKLADYFTRALPQPQAGPDVQILGLDNTILSDSTGLIFGATGDMQADEGLSWENNGLSSTVYGSESNNRIGSISGSLTGITGNTIRDFRMAMAIDQLLTVDARYGRRINEYSIGHYGVNVPDYRIDFPEFLSHRRVYLNVNQVIQSSASESNSPQGNVGAWSDTIDSSFDFVKSFVEHGYIMALGCVRVLNRTYSQGLDRLWTRISRFDFYDPLLANISDLPVYVSQLYAQLSATNEVTSIFGYQEAWADYKYVSNHIANHCRPESPNTISVWNYAEYYSSRPYLSEEWLAEDISVINRTMYLEASNTVSQFIIDIYYDYDVYRTMPLHSLPGGLTNSW